MKERIQPIVLGRTDSIRTAVEQMEMGKQAGAPAGIIIITEDDGTLAGVLTDGDIRRALIHRTDLNGPVSTIMTEDPLSITDSSGPTEMLRRLHSELDSRGESENKYHHIIITDEHERVLDVVTPFELWKRSEVRINTATVQGLGYVGLTLALTLAEQGITVYGIEIDDQKREKLAQGTPHFFERGLEPLLKEHHGDGFHVRGDMDDIDSDIYIMCVNTPTTEDGEFNTSYVEAAARDIGQTLDVHDLVVVRSTVVVGTCRHTIIPILEEESGLVAGQDFFFAYAPERTVAGNALKELKTLPQVIGGINKPSIDYASQVFQTFSKNTVPVSSIESAEMTKLLNNCYRDLVFSFANETATLCEYWGLDTHEVIEAANRGYSRNQIPKPSPGVGGPCLTKDPHLLINSGESVGYSPELPAASRSINEHMVDLVSDKVRKFATESVNQSRPKVFFMGMAYKGRPETSDIRNSPSVEILEELSNDDFNLVVYDPVVSRDRLATLNATVVDDPQEGFADASCVLILTNHPNFTRFNINDLVQTMTDPGLVFDPWSQHSEAEVESHSHVKYDRFSPH